MARSNGDGGLYKDSRGLWTAVVELPEGPDGKRRRKVVRRKNKRDALDQLGKLKDEFSKHGDLVTNSQTVGQWLTYWLEEILPGTVAPNTYTAHKNSCESFLIPMLGKVKMSKLTTMRIREFHKQLSSTPVKKDLRDKPETQRPEGYKVVGRSTMRAVHSALVVALDAAMNDRKVNVNVARLAGQPKGGAVGEAKSMSVEGVKKLLAYLATHPEGAMWITYLFTGARRGEVLGVERERVSADQLDMSWQLLNLQPDAVKAAKEDYQIRKVRGNIWLARPKSKSGWRVLPLVEPLKSVLARHLEQFEGEGLIFRTMDGEPYNPSNVSKAWRKLLASAEIDEDVNLHGTRHTLVDLLYDAGVSEQTIQQIVGHSDVKMTRSYKTRVNQGQAKLALESLGKFIDAS
ncbi:MULTISPECIES: tyrosine-type recombinase/integrase [unclassified Glutamicibacter]|uniref:tyrosine-type recombinase/integrase n=1 Tax=unclassified Glutamicibacter TaxID=2627139 RepID=UPI003821A0D6